MSTLWWDVCVAARILRRSPFVTFPAAVLLSFGVGAATSLYAIVFATWLRPLPYSDAGRLVSVLTHYPSFGLDALASPDLGTWQGTKTLGPLAAYSITTAAMDTTEETLELGRASVSGNLFTVLRVHAAAGREIEPLDDRPGSTRVVMLSDGLWRDRYSADVHVIGRSIRVDGKPYSVIGILPRLFRMPEQRRIDLVTPLALGPEFLRHGSAGGKILRGVARLARQYTIEEARAELSIRLKVSRSLEPLLYEGASVKVMPLESYASGDLRDAGKVLIIAIISILTISSANVAGLLVARAAGRSQEMAVRVALGASAFRIARHLLIEGCLLATIGVGGGIVVARVLVELLQWLRPPMLNPFEIVSIRGPVLTFVLVVLVLCSLVFGLAPALRFSSHRLRRALIVGELAISLVLLVGAALLLESLARLNSVQPGFRTDGLAAASVTMRGTRYAGRMADLRRELREQLRRIPGITAVAFADALPPTESSRVSGFSRADDPTPKASYRDAVLIRLVDDQFFAAMRIPLIAGRLFTEADIAGDAPVAVVNRSLAERYFAGESALGKELDGKPWKTVVGIVGDTRNDGIRNPARPEIYLPLTPLFKAQGGGVTYDNGLKILIRTSADPAATLHDLRRVLHELDPMLVANVRPMEKQWTDLIAVPRFQATVVSLFALLALAMASVGVYGLLSHMIVLRQREISIRIALGASPTVIRWLIIREGVGLAIAGVILGAGGAVAGSRILNAVLYQTKSQDPLTLALAATVLLVLAFCASAIPARRICGQDAARILRSE